MGSLCDLVSSIINDVQGLKHISRILHVTSAKVQINHLLFQAFLYATLFPSLLLLCVRVSTLHEYNS